MPRREMSELFGAVFHDYRPDLLPTTGGDLDHHRVCSAALVAAWFGERRTGRWVVPQVMGYEHMALRLAFGIAPSFSRLIDISEQINARLEALTIYRSRSAPPPDIRSIDNVRALAGLRGAQIDVAYGEAFHVFRVVL